MKRYLYILTLGVLFSFTSCVQEDLTVGNGFYPSSNGGIQIIGASEDFDVKHVGTRAEGGDVVSDSFISEMTMLIFKSDGTMLPAFDANRNPLASSHINIRRSNPTFLIETSKEENKGILASMEAGITAKYYDNTNEGIKDCSIYIIANVYHLIGERLEKGEIKTLAQLEAALLDTNIKLDMPYDEVNGEYIGLPMIGCARDEKTLELATFDLSYHNGNSNNNAVATIPLKKLYSKVCFSIQVNSKQMVTGQTPEFVLDDVEVFNVPSQVRMGYEAGDYLTNLPDTVATPYLYRYKNDTEKTAFSFRDNDMMPSDRKCSHSSSEDTDDVVSFYFYMPEHMVTPYYTEGTYIYPDNLPVDNRQYFKPKLIKGKSVGGVTPDDKIATFVRIHGTYTDHNAQIHDVAYDIYLGQDNTDDFEVIRNQQLDNKLIITGITNHKDAYVNEDTNGDGVVDDKDVTISIDHRVSMSDKGYNLSMEREAILDAHFEVRPLDIELQPGSSMTIEIPTAYKSWIAMEDDADADTSGTYVSNAHRKGVRKYFTTDLVSELWGANTGKIKLEHSGTDNTKTEIHRIWFYIDENPNVYDKTGAKTPNKDENGNTYKVNDTDNGADPRYRVAKVNFYFAENGQPDTSANPTATINFQQWNLWRVWSADDNRYYDIEHEEEYLNNYASDMQYGQTQDGMPWGLDGIPLSNHIPAIDASKTEQGFITWLIDVVSNFISWIDSIESMANYALNDVAYYDFYLTRDKFPVESIEEGRDPKDYKRDYSGLTMNKEIATSLKTMTDSKTKIDGIVLTEDPQSAFAYCYHKNKRNTNGEVVEQKWFLPAIDEIEDIALGAYDEFDKVFQNEKYWSCQPAYHRNYLYATVSDGAIQADYYTDDLQRARATSVFTTNGKDYININSGSPEDKYYIEKTGTGKITYQWVIIPTGITFSLTETKNTITENEYPEGNLPRTTPCRIRAVYRSGTK